MTMIHTLRALALLFLPLLAAEPLRAGGALPLGGFDPLVEKHLARTLEDRRWFHAHPELALREHESRKRIVEALSRIPGMEIVDGEWGTGVVAVLRSGNGGPLVAWRADMDGLPIEEKTGLSYASTKTDTLGGVETALSHACGHDIHMSVALGAARVLSEIRRDLAGDVLWIFQPAEETGEGSERMLAAGLFDDGRMPKSVLALHDHPTLFTGQVGSCPGWASANVDVFRLTVKGKGGHGAYPHRTIDPVALAAKMVLAFNDVVAREIDVNRQAVISVGSIQGGTKSSVIPDEVVLKATVRTRDEETRMAVKEKIERTVSGLAVSAGAPEPTIEYFLGTPSGYNDPALTVRVRATVRELLGAEADVEYDPGMGGEDFSRYGQIVPGFQFRLGVAPEGVEDMALHSSDFNPDEKAIPVGMRVVSAVLYRELIAQREMAGSH
ncbi:MAG: M20 family metallopeptidase [Candidatus Eisenbacteria bacterium]